MPPLRVTMYTDGAFVAGAEISLGNLLEALGDRVAPSLLCTNAGVLDYLGERRPDAERHLLSPVRSKWDLGPLLAHVRAVRRLRPQILHANLPTPWSCQYALLAGVLVPGVQVVAVEQAPLASQVGRQRLFKRLLSRRLAAHIAVGDRAARQVERQAGLPDHSLRTIHNGVPDVALPPALPRTRPLVGALGRLHHFKGFDVLLRALAGLPDVDAMLVGDGPERARLEALATELGLEERVELLHWQHDARRYLPGFDVFVFPSRSEGMPLALIEAMLAGRAVVAADVASVGEAIRHEVNGLLVPPDDPGALAAAISRLLADAPLRQSLGRRARETALAQFTADAMAAKYLALYRELVP